MDKFISDDTTRADAVTAWREGRARRKAARSPDGRIVDRVALAWENLGLHGRDTTDNFKRSLRDLLERSPDASPQDREIAEEAITATPGLGLPSAIRELLGTLAPLQLIGTLNDLVQTGMPWLSPLGALQAQVMAMELPRAGGMKPLAQEFLGGGAGWRCYLAALGHPAMVSKNEIGEVVPYVPLTVLDDLIDLGLIGAEEQPWRSRSDPDERIYVRARLAPETVTRSEAQQLQWRDMERRHAFLKGEDLTGDDLYGRLAGLWRGEVDVRLRDMLPVEQQTLLDQIQHGAQLGRWPQPLVNDQGLWGALAALWTPTEAIEAKQSEFHAWRGLHLCYRHLFMGDIKKATAQTEKLLKAAAAVDARGERFLSRSTFAEVNNLGAYLAQQYNELEFAIKLLSDEDVASDEVAARNLALLRKRQETLVNDREDWQNPYLVLRLAHGDPDWKEQSRQLLRSVRGDTEREAAINRAERRLRRATSESQFYVVPLSEDIFLSPADGRTAVLLPPAGPLPRRTPETRSEDLLLLREQAARELLIEFHVPSREMIVDGIE
ncbi:hypothetical protein AB0K48_43975 [Nonomuraea sp. NPDC055795]